MRVLIIAHPIAGIDKKKRDLLQNITAHISKNGGNVDITYTMKPGIGKIHSSRAALQGYDTVFAAGGDGTVNDVASGLVGRQIPLGIIPMGTGNGLARSLGIPFTADKLNEMFSKNKTIAIDVGKIASNFFMATAGIGYDAVIANEFNKQEKSDRSMVTYIYIAVKKYFTKKPENLVLIADGKKLIRKVFALTLANVSQYGGGALIAPQASPESGTLYAVLLPKLSVFKTIPMIVKLYKGTINEIDDIEYIEFKNLKIKRENDGLYHCDGEAFEGNATLNAEVIPQALQAIVP